MTARPPPASWDAASAFPVDFRMPTPTSVPAPLPTLIAPWLTAACSTLLSGTEGLGRRLSAMAGQMELVCIEAALGTFLKAGSNHLQTRPFPVRGHSGDVRTRAVSQHR